MTTEAKERIDVTVYGHSSTTKMPVTVPAGYAILYKLIVEDCNCELSMVPRTDANHQAWVLVAVYQLPIKTNHHTHSLICATLVPNKADDVQIALCRMINEAYQTLMGVH